MSNATPRCHDAITCIVLFLLCAIQVAVTSPGTTWVNTGCNNLATYGALGGHRGAILGLEGTNNATIIVAGGGKMTWHPGSVSGGFATYAPYSGLWRSHDRGKTFAIAGDLPVIQSAMMVAPNPPPGPRGRMFPTLVAAPDGSAFAMSGVGVTGDVATGGNYFWSLNDVFYSAPADAGTKWTGATALPRPWGGSMNYLSSAQRAMVQAATFLGEKLVVSYHDQFFTGDVSAPPTIAWSSVTHAGGPFGGRTRVNISLTSAVLQAGRSPELVFIGNAPWSPGYEITNDVWSWTETSQWTLRTSRAAWPGNSSSLLALPGVGGVDTLFVTGAESLKTLATGVWSSDDMGVSWTLRTVLGGWFSPPRASVLGSSLLLLGGGSQLFSTDDRGLFAPMSPQISGGVIPFDGGNFTVPVGGNSSCDYPLPWGWRVTYTTDGADPTTASMPVLSLGEDQYTVFLGTNPVGAPGYDAVLKLRAFAPGYASSGSPVVTAHVIVPGIVSAPTISPGGGDFADAVNVSLGVPAHATWVYYSTDGGQPRYPYTGQLLRFKAQYGTTITIRAQAGSSLKSSWVTTIASTAVATFNFRAASPPTITAVPPQSSGVQATRLVTLNAGQTPGSVVYYTTDGSVPTSASQLYVRPFELYGIPGVHVASVIVRAVCVAPAPSVPSPSAEAAYLMDGPLPAPVFSPDGGRFVESVNVTLSLPNQQVGSQIYYTTDGTEPRPPDIGYAYTEPILLLHSCAGLKAMASNRGWPDSFVNTSQSFVVAAPTRPAGAHDSCLSAFDLRCWPWWKWLLVAMSALSGIITLARVVLYLRDPVKRRRLSERWRRLWLRKKKGQPMLQRGGDGDDALLE